jgi:hypothetical protein
MKNLINIISAVLLFNIAIQTSANAQCVQCDFNSFPSGNYASVGGMSSIASGQASLAFGLNTNAVGNYSIALGKFVTSNGASSVTIGRYLQTNTSPAMIIGCGYDESNYLQNSNPNSLMIGFNSNLPTLFVNGAVGNGFTGKVGIGNVTEPQAKLHIKADVNEDASLKLETSGSSNFASITFADDEHSIKAKMGSDMTFSTLTGKSFVFENGKVGVAAANPQAMLHVNGDLQVGDEGNPQPIRFFGSINAEGEHAVSFGTGNSATGDYSFAGGINSSSSGYCSFAFGNQAQAIGNNYCYAIGPSATAGYSGAFAFGKFVNANAYQAFVFGNGINATNILTNDISSSMMIGFNSNKPTFFVEGAVGIGYSGKIGIGDVTDPQAKLHIKADANEDASLKLETSGSSNFASIAFADDEHSIKAKTGSDMTFSTLSGKSFVFENGKVGVATANPQAMLHVNGDLQVGDEENPQPIRFFGSINAEGEHAVSFGTGNSATGVCSFAAGFQNEATGNYSFAIGYQNAAFGNHSIAMGKKAKATGIESLAVGWLSEANGNASLALGAYTKTSEDALLSIALGSKVTTNVERSMAIGYGLYDNPMENNISNSLMVGFESNLPTFFVGPSSGIGKTGKIGIGNVTDPQAKLHIKADVNEDASLKLETSGSSNFASIAFADDEHSIKAKIGSDMTFSTPTDMDYVFENGNIGVDTYNPVAKLQVNNGDIFIEDIDRGIVMKSPDGNCWRGKLDNNGALQFVQVNCEDLATGQEELKPGSLSQVNIYPNPAGNRVFVSIDPQLSGAMLEITDVNGNLVHSEKLFNADSFIDLTDFTSGLYIFKINDKTGKAVKSEKIIKN